MKFVIPRGFVAAALMAARRAFQPATRSLRGGSYNGDVCVPRTRLRELCERIPLIAQKHGVLIVERLAKPDAGGNQIIHHHHSLLVAKLRAVVGMGTNIGRVAHQEQGGNIVDGIRNARQPGAYTHIGFRQLMAGWTQGDEVVELVGF